MLCKKKKMQEWDKQEEPIFMPQAKEAASTSHTDIL